MRKKCWKYSLLSLIVFRVFQFTQVWGTERTFIKAIINVRREYPSDSWRNGVRYVDIRIFKDMKIHHDKQYLKSTLTGDVLPILRKLLAEHSSDIILARMSYKKRYC